LETFEAELHASGSKRVTVRLEAETAAAKQHFDHWLAEIRARYPAAARLGEPRADAARSVRSPGLAPRVAKAGVTKDLAATATWIYGAREAVGDFPNPEALEAAVNELEISGFDRSAISVLATEAKAKGRIQNLYRSAGEIEDSGDTPRRAFVARNSRTEPKRLRSEFRSILAASQALLPWRRQEALWRWPSLPRSPAVPSAPVSALFLRPRSDTVIRLAYGKS
jgi:hypothetical protein